MSKDKISFDDIYREFKTKFPNLSKAATRWEPEGQMQIRIFFEDGREGKYDGILKTCKFVPSTKR